MAQVSEVVPKDVHSLLHPMASIPEGPAPSVHKAAGLIHCASIALKMTGWTGDG